MRDAVRQIVPSMFHRRLLLLTAVVLLLMIGLAAKTAHLTTGKQHADRQQIIRKALERPKLTPTSRGRIFDRKGRTLAEDRPGWDITVTFPALSGHWAYTRSRQAAERSVGRTAWREMSAEAQDLASQPFIKPYLVKLEALKRALAEFGGVTVEELEDRQRSVVSGVQRMVANASAAKRDHQLTVLKKSEADLTWADVYVEVAEEFQSHPMLFDVTPETVTRIDQLIARARLEQDAFDAAVQKARENGEPVPADDRQYDAWLEVEPQRVRVRSYPWESMGFTLDRSSLPGPLQNDTPLDVTVDGIGRHIIGSLRRVHRGDPHWQRREFSAADLGGYRPNDLIGRAGVERSMEDVLRGQRGQRVTHLDTGEEEVVRPVSGRDIHLTIDISLQMRLQALMSHAPEVGLMRSQDFHHAGESAHAPQPGDPLNGAAIVVDIDNSEVIAAVSVPGTSLDMIENHGREYFGDHVNVPYKFRPVAGYQDLYEPGSTNKPLVLAAAITDGIIGPDEKIETRPGHLWENEPTVYRDWLTKLNPQLTFGRLNGVEALTVSSNVFFGKLAQEFGRQDSFDKLAWWFNQFGFGRRPGSGLDEEARGQLPPGGVTERDAAYMAIGEGAMTVTPIQVANAHATLARGGLYIPPTFVQDRSRPGPKREATQLYLSPAACDRALRGMDGSANSTGTSLGYDRGTTNHIRFEDGRPPEPVFTVDGVKVYAKSGTAEPNPLLQPAEDGKLFRDADGNFVVIRTGNHAWVVALVQPDGEPRPTHAIACVVEYGGSGGRTAGPIVNQIIRAMAVEGYLGDAAQRAATPTATANAEGSS